MVFSSYFFLFVFLPAALGLYYASPGKWKHLTLTIASYLFYGWSNPYFTLLMLTSTLVDYGCGIAVGHYAKKRTGSAVLSPKLFVVISIATNLGLLGFFKYFNFGLDNYNALVRSVGLGQYAHETYLRVILPLGISFYTFQSMSYTIDIYRDRAKPMANFVDFACYVSMFPQLVAGPIIRFHEIAKQLRSRTHTFDKFEKGIAFFSLGLAKKILIANPMGKVADVCFDAASRTALDAWYGISAYSFQIYFDFSGYSDMAIGLGFMLGFSFPINFDYPYRSQSITEFWRRWHMSLSRWLKDYLYISLGGNQKGPVRTYVNLALVMLLGGLWHGASWNFVVWGALHGTLLIWERLVGKKPFYASAPAPLKMIATYVLVLITWVFFRADTLLAALSYLADMAGMGGAAPQRLLISGIIYRPYYLAAFVLSAFIVWACRDTRDFLENPTTLRVASSLALFCASVGLMMWQSYNPFIYFIF